jgi:hypothetical protein
MYIEGRATQFICGDQKCHQIQDPTVLMAIDPVIEGQTDQRVVLAVTMLTLSVS